MELALLACMGSENLALTLAPGATPVALFAGAVLVTLGDAMSSTRIVKVPCWPLKPSTRIRYVVPLVALNATLLLRPLDPQPEVSSSAATSVRVPRALPL
jgi:hypothetical protein